MAKSNMHSMPMPSEWKDLSLLSLVLVIMRVAQKTTNIGFCYSLFLPVSVSNV